MNYEDNNEYIVPVVDAIILNENNEVLLVKRHKNPFSGMWVLPGGKIDVEDESAPAAAKREVKEETGLNIEITHLFDVYSDPKRDVRFHSVSTVYIGHVIDGEIKSQPGETDDVRFFSLSQLPKMGFGHKQIIEQMQKQRKKGFVKAYDDRELSVYAREWEKNGYTGNDDYLSIAVDTIVRNKKGDILWTFRAKRWCTNTWILPGGHMKLGETVVETMKRESMEEAEVEVEFDRILTTAYGPFRNPKHPTLTVVCLATLKQELPFEENIEVSERHWVPVDNFPTPIGFDCEKLMKYYTEFLKEGLTQIV